MKKQPTQKLREERGAETIEFIAAIPLVLLTIVMIWQFVLLGYTAIVVASASREAARAAAVGGNWRAAAINASPGWGSATRQVSASCGGNVCRATVRLQIKKAPLPLIGHLPEYPWITSTSVMRYEPPYH